MFVDASALVAILTDESARDALLDRIDRDAGPITSALAIFETVAALARKKAQSVTDARAQVEEFLAVSGIRVVPLAEAEGSASLDAFERFGKGRGHPARLNMGDCFAYACARVHGVPLLFVGDDFARTDIPAATA
ncbi:type II toxin-antitoxin system VapC family toxin [Methylobacterium oxalidis]|uniref:type II toxin-antitoxin system VapC family toxin n=1 Tax=Methylobacterium oxalidis TaxID=944322 RepID=UPI0033157C64